MLAARIKSVCEYERRKYDDKYVEDLREGTQLITKYIVANSVSTVGYIETGNTRIYMTYVQYKHILRHILIPHEGGMWFVQCARELVFENGVCVPHINTVNNDEVLQNINDHAAALIGKSFVFHETTAKIGYVYFGRVVDIDIMLQHMQKVPRHKARVCKHTDHHTNPHFYNDCYKENNVQDLTSYIPRKIHYPGDKDNLVAVLHRLELTEAINNMATDAGTYFNLIPKDILRHVINPYLLAGGTYWDNDVKIEKFAD